MQIVLYASRQIINKCTSLQLQLPASYPTPKLATESHNISSLRQLSLGRDKWERTLDADRFLVIGLPPGLCARGTRRLVFTQFILFICIINVVLFIIIIATMKSALCACDRQRNSVV